MPEPQNPDQEAADMLAYTLRTAGWIIDLLIVDSTGARVAAHLPTRRGQFLTQRGFRELER